LKHDDIKQRLRLSKDSTVDVAILRIGDLIAKQIHGQATDYMSWSAVIVNDGPIAGSKEACFAFLGIYSGEPYLQEEPIDLDDIIITRKHGFNLGTVWYAELVADIVNKGMIFP